MHPFSPPPKIFSININDMSKTLKIILSLVILLVLSGFVLPYFQIEKFNYINKLGIIIDAKPVLNNAISKTDLPLVYSAYVQIKEPRPVPFYLRHLTMVSAKNVSSGNVEFSLEARTFFNILIDSETKLDNAWLLK